LTTDKSKRKVHEVSTSKDKEEEEESVVVRHLRLSESQVLCLVLVVSKHHVVWFNTVNSDHKTPLDLLVELIGFNLQEMVAKADLEEDKLFVSDLLVFLYRFSVESVPKNYCLLEGRVEEGTLQLERFATVQETLWIKAVPAFDKELLTGVKDNEAINTIVSYLK